LKRAWTKKVKSLPSNAVGNEALERQLQPHPNVKRRIFRTSAAMIGLTVSIGTPNFILTQAAPVPEGRSSQSESIQEATLETVQNTPATETYQVMPVTVVTPYQSSALLSSGDRITPKPSAVKKIIAPSYHPPAPVVQASVPEASLTLTQQPSSQITAQEPVVKQDVRAILRQHQQAVSLEQTQAIAPLVATSQSRLIAQLKASQKAEIADAPAMNEVLPTQVETDSSLLAVRQQPPEVALNPEANSNWTAKQRLLVARLKNTQNLSPVNHQQETQVPSDVDLAASTTTNSQAKVELPAPVVAVNSTEQASSQLSSEVPAVANSEEREFTAQPSPLEIGGMLATALNQEANTSAQPSPAVTAVTEPLAQNLQPVFVLPEASIAQEQINTAPTEIKEVDEQKIATRNTPEVDEQKIAAQDTFAEIENATPTKEALVNVNEPIIVSSATLEYQVKPGDTLTNIASAHRLSPPEIAKFNNLPNPNLLLVDQRLKIPNLTSMKTQANVVVLPPVEKVEPVAKVNGLSAPTLEPVNKVVLVSTEQKTVPENTAATAYTGVGGSISDAEVETQPLEPTALSALQTQYGPKSTKRRTKATTQILCSK